MKRNILAVVYAVVMGSTAIISGNVWGAEEGQKGALSEEEQEFVTKAAQGNMAEVKVGKMAQEKATSDAVRQFAQKMVQDHGEANQKLKKIAQAKGVQWPEQPKEEHQELESKLSKEEGQKFDEKYIKEMVKDHEKDVSEYEEATETVKDQELKQYVQTTLPKLQSHLDMVKQIQENM